jgi:hypothetical protein
MVKVSGILRAVWLVQIESSSTWNHSMTGVLSVKTATTQVTESRKLTEGFPATFIHEIP